MIITILNVEETQKKTKNGKNYSQLEIAYKDENGKVTSKKIFSFSFPECFDVLKTAKKDQVFDINSQKNNDTGYWDWVKATHTSDVAHTPTDPDQPSKSNKVNTYSDPRETKEERELRQRMIVRQSCLAQAVAYATEADEASLLEVAQSFENWVMRGMTKDIQTMDDDIPF